jgi:cytochrome c oxidase subunit 1
MLAAAAADYQYHDTYFVVAHFHYVIVGGVVFGVFAGLHYWWPKFFGTMLSEKLGKLAFWPFFIGFHLTFFIQHFLGLMGMPRRYWKFLPNQDLDLGNLVSTIGAFLMAIGAVIFLINVIVTSVKGEKVSGDPWDGRTLEWSIPSPPPFYNFTQTPLVRGLDPLWIEKRQGNGKMTPAEPLGDIHMPNNSFIPFVMSLGLFIAGFGFIYQVDDKNWLIVGIAGMLITLGSMFVRSVKDDLGYHIHKEDLEKGAGSE